MAGALTGAAVAALTPISNGVPATAIAVVVTINFLNTCYPTSSTAGTGAGSVSASPGTSTAGNGGTGTGTTAGGM